MRPDAGRGGRRLRCALAAVALLAGCARAPVERQLVAPPLPRVSLVVVGGERALGSGRRGVGYPTNWSVQVWRQLPVQSTMVDLGRAGFTVEDLDSLTSDLQAVAPTMAAVWIGDDDALRTTGVARFERGVIALLDRLAAAGASRIAVALPPAWDTLGLTVRMLQPYREAIRRAVDSHPGALAVDLADVPGAESGDNDGVAAAFLTALRG